MEGGKTNSAVPYPNPPSSSGVVQDSRTPSGEKASLTDLSQGFAQGRGFTNASRHPHSINSSSNSGVLRSAMSRSSLDGQTADSSRSSEDSCKEENHGPRTTAMTVVPEEGHEQWRNVHNRTNNELNRTDNPSVDEMVDRDIPTRIIRSYHAVEEWNDAEEKDKEALRAQQQCHIETMEDHDYLMLKETIQETANPLLRSTEELQSVYPTYHSVQRAGNGAPHRHNSLRERTPGRSELFEEFSTAARANAEDNISWRYGYDEQADVVDNNGFNASSNLQRLLAPKCGETSDDIAERRRPARERFSGFFAVSHAGPNDPVVSGTLSPLDMMPTSFFSASAGGGGGGGGTDRSHSSGEGGAEDNPDAPRVVVEEEEEEEEGGRTRNRMSSRYEMTRGTPNGTTTTTNNNNNNINNSRSGVFHENEEENGISQQQHQPQGDPVYHCSNREDEGGDQQKNPNTAPLVSGGGSHHPLPVFVRVDEPHQGTGGLEQEEERAENHRLGWQEQHLPPTNANPHAHPLAIASLGCVQEGPTSLNGKPLPSTGALPSSHHHDGNDGYAEIADDVANDSVSTVGTAGSMSVFSPSFSAPSRRSFAGFAAESTTAAKEEGVREGETPRTTAAVMNQQQQQHHDADSEGMNEEESPTQGLTPTNGPFTTSNPPLQSTSNGACPSNPSTSNKQEKQGQMTADADNHHRHHHQSVIVETKRLQLPFSKTTSTTTSNTSNTTGRPHNTTHKQSRTLGLFSNGIGVVGGKSSRVPGDTPPIMKSRRVVELFSVPKGATEEDPTAKASADGGAQRFSKRPLPSPPTVPLSAPTGAPAGGGDPRSRNNKGTPTHTAMGEARTGGARKISLAGLLSRGNQAARPPPLSPQLDAGPSQPMPAGGSSQVGGGGLTTASAGTPTTSGGPAPPVLGPSSSSVSAGRSKTHEDPQNPTVGGAVGASSGSVNTTSVSFSELGGNYSPTPAFSEHLSTPTPQSQRHIHRATKIPIPITPPIIQFSRLLQHRFVEELYDIGSKISEGTYGEVYLGVERETNIPVALKRLKRLKGLDGFPLTSLREVTALQHIQAQRAKLLQAMQRENTASAAALEDPLPNIIRLRNVLLSSTSEHDIFLIFDYADYSMAGLLSGGHYPFETDEIPYIFRQVVVALSRLHLMGIIHRDIKADNLLLSRQGNVFLADFGLCAFKGRSDGGRDLTPSMIHLHYRPPEMLLGEGYDDKVDIWSVGCFLAQVYLGYPPFLHRSSTQAKKPAAGQRSAETELEQLANICDILGPLPTDTMVDQTDGGDATFRRTGRHLGALRELYRAYTTGNLAGSRLLSNGRIGSGSGGYTPFPSALFEPSPTYQKYNGFSGWFRQAVKERHQRYAREALSKPDVNIRLPVDPSDAAVHVLSSIFTFSHRRPSAMQLLEAPFFNYVDVVGVSVFGMMGTVLAREKLTQVENQIQNKIAQKMRDQPDSHVAPSQRH